MRESKENPRTGAAQKREGAWRDQWADYKNSIKIA